MKKFPEREIHNRDDIANADVMPGLKNFKNQFLLKQNWKDVTSSAAD
ncbi:MAG: hypothetical protein AB3N21_05485 [Ruegeria sp.]